VLYVVHLIVPTAKTTFVVLVFQVDAWCGELQVSQPPAGAEERILDAQFVPVEEAIQRLEQGFRFANEPAIGFLSGDSPPGAAWVYQGDPAKGDHLIERICFEGQMTVQ
jgi:hypothetical protein